MKKCKTGFVAVGITVALMVVYGLEYLAYYSRARSEYDQAHSRYAKCYNQVLKQDQQADRILSSGQPNVLDPMIMVCQQPMPVVHTMLWLPKYTHTKTKTFYTEA